MSSRQAASDIREQDLGLAPQPLSGGHTSYPSSTGSDTDAVVEVDDAAPETALIEEL
jgi:hypothetical protein